MNRRTQKINFNLIDSNFSEKIPNFQSSKINLYPGTVPELKENMSAETS